MKTSDKPDRPPVFRIEVDSSLHLRSAGVLSQLSGLGVMVPLHLKITDLYFIEGWLDEKALRTIAKTLICDPVTETYRWKQLNGNRVASLLPDGSLAVEVSFRPGVTDTVAVELLHAARRVGLAGIQGAATGIRYVFSPVAQTQVTPELVTHIARNLLVNATIQHYSLGELSPVFLHPEVDIQPPERIPLAGLSQKELEAISARRRLALDGREMLAIQAYFGLENRIPTDAELETIAQTWSEHCIHKTFKARIDVAGEPTSVDGLLKTYLRSATQKIGAPWVRSAFVDNAGVIAFDDQYDLSFKVETHNHPSAIEPFGGANTGVGGVVRDILGVSHRPIAATDVLCFGPAGTPLSSLPQGVLHPQRIRAGVVAGVEDYGNKLGLPTVNGAVLYHPGYTANPLVYCGCVGLGPRDSHPRTPQPGDRIIVLGGRTGRDGLRGATFSSLAMDAQTGEVAGASVQIGDPVTEKGLIEVVTLARDQGLYHAITDCGAGGLSSAVGEMSAGLGARVDLSKVLLKYAGLQPWEIWLSEAQERMVLAVPPDSVSALAALCAEFWVEWQDIGVFVSTGRLVVGYQSIPVVDLDNNFLHDGLPRMQLQATLPRFDPTQLLPAPFSSGEAGPHNLESLLLALLAHPNLASKEEIIRRYDHHVRGMTIVPPLVGLMADGPSDAVVLKPLETAGWQGFTLANGINPFIGELDAYAMAFSAVDEAVRNAVAVGANPDRIAILDNFCWGSPRRPETLGSLLQAARGCHDAALYYNTPFISGKDSLNNEYIGSDGERHAIPGTLLISSIAIHPDIRQAVTMDLKTPGNLLCLLGDWQPALGGSHAWMLAAPAYFAGLPLSLPPVPENALAVYRAYHRAVRAGLVRSAHDLSEGGLLACAAEMAIAGRLGLTLRLPPGSPDARLSLFGETNGCLLVEIPPEFKQTFDEMINPPGTATRLPLRWVGEVTAEPWLQVFHLRQSVGSLSQEDLQAAWRTPALGVTPEKEA